MANKKEAEAAPKYRVLRSFNARIGDQDVFITRANAERVEELSASKREEFIRSGSIKLVDQPQPADKG